MGTKNRNLLIVRSVTDQGMSVVQAAKKYEVSRQWVDTLLHRYRAEGPAGLEPLSRAPGSSPSRIVENVRARIIGLRADLTRQGVDNGAETIAWHLAQGTPVLMLINDRHVTTSNANTGQIIAEHHIDPNKDYQPQTPRNPRPT